MVDFDPSDDILDLSATPIRNFAELEAASTSFKKALWIDLEGAGVTLPRTRLSDLTEDNFVFAPDGPPEDDDIEVASESELVIESGTDRFVPTAGPILIDVVGDVALDENGKVHAFLNGNPVPPEFVSVGADGRQIELSMPLTEGANRIEVYAADTAGGLLALAELLWAGDSTLEVTILDENGAPVAGASVVASLQEQQEVGASATTDANGVAEFQNLPNRNILIQAQGASGLFASVGVLGGQGSVALALQPFEEPSSIANNDFSQGLEGWNIGDAPVTLVPHVEEGTDVVPAVQVATVADAALPSPEARAAAGQEALEAAPAATTFDEVGILQEDDIDLVLSTLGEGEQSISRTFTIEPGTQSVTVRFKFITSEVPGGYFGTEFNDYYRVSIRSQEGGGVISESNSMNGLGLAAFDASGATAFREVSLPTNEEGDTVQVEVAVANVADNLLDSQVVVDLIEEEPIEITALDLNDIDNSDLTHLSASGATPYFSGNTRIHGTITIKGEEDETLSDVVLEILSGSAVVATAELAPAARAALIGQTFGSDETLSIGNSSHLFNLPNAAAAGVPVAQDGQVQLRVKATATGGSEALRESGAVDVLTRYEGANRYGQGRDANQGGDDWARPSTIALLEHFANEITVGDISNMNGGRFPPHASHRDGRHVDGWYPGYNNRDAAAANRMIDLLNDDEYGSDITTAFVTYNAVAGNAFFDAISGVALDDGRLATDVIAPLAGHTTHFHWVLDA